MSEIDNDSDLDFSESAPSEIEPTLPEPKQKPSKADLCRLLDYLVRDPVLAHGMKAIGRKSDSLIFQWMRSSREGDERFLIQWPDADGREVWLHDAIVIARQMNLAAFEAILRRDCSEGIPRVLRQPDGTPIYEIDHKLIAEFEGDADAARAAGHKDAFYAHDQQGARIPVIVFDSAPAALRVHTARSTLPGFNPAHETKTDAKFSGGVLVLRATAGADAKPLPPYSRQAMQEASAGASANGQEGGRSRAADSGSSAAPPAAGSSGRAAGSPLRADLLRRLADLRARPNRESGRPSGRVNLGGGSSRHDDPPENGAA